jgi:hypothetical protein
MGHTRTLNKNQVEPPVLTGVMTLEADSPLGKR